LDCKWQYKGVLHEYAACEKPNPRIMKLEGDYNICARTMGGARNLNIDPIEKYSRDAIVLEEALKEDPTSTRDQFYLAQSYFDSQQWDKSDAAYRKRVEMGGWEEEVFYSLYRIAMIAAITNKTFGEIKEKFLMAWNYRPIRAEPLYQIAKMYRMVNQPRLAYLYAKMAKDMPYPHFDILFIDEDVYKWQVDDEIASTAFYLHRFDEGIDAAKKCMSNPLYPESEKQRMETNLKLYEHKMVESADMIAAMKQKEAQSKPSEPPKVMKTIIENKREEELRRDNLKRLLNRKKDRKAKSR
jgi:hypothetical protein